MKKVAFAALGLLVLSGCADLQAVVSGAAVGRTVMDPAVPVQDKACTVLAWGVPIAMQRATTMTVRQRQLADGAARAASAYCAGRDLSWQQRAVAAADELSLVLWDIVK